jgi:hypothetical protein
MTDTELSVIAALAQIGLIGMPVNGYSAPAARHADGVVDEGEKQILPDISHRRPAESFGPARSP